MTSISRPTSPRTEAMEALAQAFVDTVEMLADGAIPTDAGIEFVAIMEARLAGLGFAIEREAAAATLSLPLAVERLAEAASEMLLWIDTYDDAMGHGYCAMQSGDYPDPCTCGFEEKRDRWKAAISRLDEGAL